MRLTDQVFALDSTRGSYVFLILGEETALIDTGRRDQRRGIVSDLRALGIQLSDIRHILLTHHDLDHTGNAAYLQKASGAKLWISNEDKPYLTGELPRPGIKRVIETLMRPIRPQAPEGYPPAAHIAGIEVIPTPGHTPGHVCLLYHDVLFAGDLVHVKKGKPMPYPAFWNWDSSLLQTSLRQIDALSFQWLCPAHGRPMKRH